MLDRPVIDHWWQTESGWPMAANCMGIEHKPVKPGSPTVPVPGYDIRILDVDRSEVGRGVEGAITVKLPLPPGCLPTLWNADDRFVESYLSAYPGYYLTADGGYIDEDGYLFVMGRTDDVINVAGHRLSTGAMEEVIASHPDIAECAVIGIAVSMKGQVPVGLVVLKAGVNRPHDEIKSEVVKMMRDRIGPIACYKDTSIVDRLPKTRSGKILRRTMRAIADGKEYNTPSTIDDPSTLDNISIALSHRHAPGAGPQLVPYSRSADLDIKRYYPRLCGSLGHHGPKMVLGRPIPGSIPRRSLLFRPNHLDVARIAQISLKIYLFPRLLAYSPLGSQILGGAALY